MLKLTLDSLHRELGAKFFEFAGWEMPMNYSNSLKEALAVRNFIGIFDVSHMGRFLIKGDQATEFLQRATSNNLAVASGRAKYTLTLNERGGVKDDNVAFKIADDLLLFIVNASNRKKIWDWFQTLLSQWNLKVELSDETFKTVMIAVQGPKARELVHEVLGTTFNISKFGVKEHIQDGVRFVISRTGYTGEDGYEIVTWNLSWAESLFRELMKKGALPCGLVARDILRLEAGLVLYGNDIDENINPFEAGLDFAVDLDKEFFVGKSALIDIKEEGVNRKRVALLSKTRNSPRRGNEIYKDGEKVGVVTSGTFSPILGKGIGMGYVHSRLAKPGEELVVKGTKEIKVEVSKTPLYDETKYGWRRST